MEYVPLIIQCLPSSVLTAVVCKPMTSLPAKASEIARQINFFPERTSGTMRALSSSLPKFKTGGSPITFPPRRPIITELVYITWDNIAYKYAYHLHNHVKLHGQILG